jgi:GT2 family glycosyltransferase
MTSTPRVSVVVVTYNGLKYLAPCLQSLRHQSLPRDAYEVVVVDNASTDGSAEAIRANHPWVRLVAQVSNSGFAGGCNAGIRHSQGQYIALLNNDAIASPNWLERLLAAGEEDHRIGGVATKIRFDHDPTILNSAGLVLSWNGYGEDRGFRAPDRGQFDEATEVFGGCGAGVLLNRDMLSDVGLFDESLFMYYEDLDLAWRARLRGWRFVYEPAAEIRHVHCGSSGERSPFFCFHDERNRVLVNVKNNAAIAAIYVLAGFFIHAARTWRDVLMGKLGREHGRAYARAALSLAHRLPHAFAERYRIRHVRRLVPDAAIQRLVRPRPNAVFSRSERAFGSHGA